jgi:hypothetical protein
VETFRALGRPSPQKKRTEEEANLREAQDAPAESTEAPHSEVDERPKKKRKTNSES